MGFWGVESMQQNLQVCLQGSTRSYKDPDQDAPGEESEGDESSSSGLPDTRPPAETAEETAPEETVPESPPPRAPEAEEGGVVRQHQTRRVRVRPERTVRDVGAVVLGFHEHPRCVYV